MARRWLQGSQGKWQRLFGEYPQALLDTHPSGKAVAMQVSAYLEVQAERAAIWNTRTRKIAWRPKNVNAISWLPSGNTLLVVGESFNPEPSKRGIIETPLQSEYAHFFEMRSWPELELVSRCEIEPPTGWLVDVMPVPSSHLACFVWEDQGEAGIEFISTESEPRQLRKRGYFGRSSNLIQGPSFSPDGRFAVLTYGKNCWWSSEPETPSPGGSRLVGWVVVGDLESRRYHKIQVKATVPKAWLPADPDDVIHNEFLSSAIFLDNDEFKVDVPTGTQRYFSASKAQEIPHRKETTRRKQRGRGS